MRTAMLGHKTKEARQPEDWRSRVPPGKAALRAVTWADKTDTGRRPTRPAPETADEPDRPLAAEVSPRLREQFEELADQWTAETALLSSIPQRTMHWTYQRIIGLGPDVVPLILDRLARTPDHWFWALSALTGVDPARGRQTVDGAVDAWLEWGRVHGFIR